MLKVYVAGKYSDTSVLGVLNNIRKGIKVSRELFVEGYAPFCPWFDFLFGITYTDDEMYSVDVEKYYEYSVAWLGVADCVFLLPEGTENSVGVQKELARAKELNIPVFTDRDELREYSKKRRNKIDYYEPVDVGYYLCSLCKQWVSVNSVDHHLTCRGVKHE